MSEQEIDRIKDATFTEDGAFQVIDKDDVYTWAPEEVRDFLIEELERAKTKENMMAEEIANRIQESAVLTKQMGALVEAMAEDAPDMLTMVKEHFTLKMQAAFDQESCNELLQDFKTLVTKYDRLERYVKSLEQKNDNEGEPQ